MRLDKYIYIAFVMMFGLLQAWAWKDLDMHVLILRFGADVISSNLGRISDRTCAWIFGIVMGPRTMSTTLFLLGE